MAVKFQCKSPMRCDSVKKGPGDLFPTFDVDVEDHKIMYTQRPLPRLMREVNLSSQGDFSSFTKSQELLGDAFSYPWAVKDVWIDSCATCRGVPRYLVTLSDSYFLTLGLWLRIL